MELKKLTLLLLVFCLTFLCVNTVAAADSDQHVVVWQDGRDGPGTSHLYYKNLKTGEGGRVSKVDSTQFYASISGNIVVWEDDRDGVIHVYYKNLVTGEGGRISNVNSIQSHPSINGDTVFWEDFRDGEIHIYYKNLVTGEGGRISKVDSTQLIRTHTV